MKHFSTPSLLKSLLLAVLFIAAYLPSRAEWEQVFAHPTTQAHFITSKGTFLLSDFDDNRQGGIYISEDKGATWTKTKARDFNYHKFYEADGYVYALGYNARIARSSDDGHTWDILNYTKALEGVVDEKSMEALVAYGITKVGDKLYISDFAGGGILVSPDNGETWSLTDRESLYINVGGEKTMDSFYNLVDFKGHIYAFGALSVHRYDIAADKWEPVNVRSNFMAVSTIFNDCLVCGRSISNSDPEEDYLVYTSDGYTWNGIKAPTPLWEVGISLYVRALYSDDKYIYSTGPEGLMRNPQTPGPEFINTPDFFFTPDFGETWTHVGGLPARTYPLTVTSDDDYVYVAIYYPIPTGKGSGLWRIAKKELVTGVQSITTDGKVSVQVKANVMEISTTANHVAVYNQEGKTVRQAGNVSRLDLGMLAKGIYAYEVVTPEGRVTGKFIK